MIVYLIISILLASSAFAARSERHLFCTGIAFYAAQAGFAAWILAGGLYETTSAAVFTFDAAGTLFYLLLTLVSAFAYFHSEAYLKEN
ncbi:MAG: hydrogenase 4 subunit F, partial [Alistipes sp.]|nr:hydrogenase 4 subunit F [Alistipes sp.]